MAEAKKKDEVDVELVKMADGRAVEFPGKKQIKKESFIADDGTITVRVDFRNGETLTYTPTAAMIPKLAAHGAEQKLGDEIAGLRKADGSDADIDDKYLVMEELKTRLDNGEWSTVRESNGMAGTSVLLRAIMEVKGLAIEKVKAFLADKTQKQKIALRESPALAPVVKRIEAEKASKKIAVDVTKELAELDALA